MKGNSKRKSGKHILECIEQSINMLDKYKRTEKSFKHQNI